MDQTRNTTAKHLLLLLPWILNAPHFVVGFQVWMCGGQLLFVPCSRVGHVYRLPGWRGNPPPSYVPANAVYRVSTLSFVVMNG